MMGKTHLATALAHTACLQGHQVLFTTAVEAINSLSAAQAQCRLKTELKKFLAPTVLAIDELGYLELVPKAGDAQTGCFRGFHQIMRTELFGKTAKALIIMGRASQVLAARRLVVGEGMCGRTR